MVSRPSKQLRLTGSEEEFQLPAKSELRFESERGCCLRLLEGKAEMFGAELTCSRLYRLPGKSKSAVTTWHGCKLKLSGDHQECYTSQDISALTVYINLHAHLRQSRNEAEINQTAGPRVLIAGATHVGKSTLCRMLVNWAARDGHEPVLIDLDVGQNQIVLPGAVGSLLVRRPCQPDDNGWFAEQPACALHYGEVDPVQNFPLYQHVLDVLAMMVSFRCENNNRSLIGGTVVNTFGWVQGDKGYRSLLHSCNAFEVDVVCVIDHERLYNRLSSDLPSTKVLLIPKSGGVIGRSTGLSAALRTSRIREYFYGTPARPLYPHTFTIQIANNKSSITIPEASEKGIYVLYRVGMAKVPLSCLPIGMQEAENQKEVVRYKEPLSDLVNHMLAVSYASHPDKILNTNVAGYIVVTGIKEDKQSQRSESSMLEILSPQSFPLPGNILLYSKVLFIDMM